MIWEKDRRSYFARFSGILKKVSKTIGFGLKIVKEKLLLSYPGRFTVWGND